MHVKMLRNHPPGVELIGGLNLLAECLLEYARRRFVYVVDGSGKVMGYADLEGFHNPSDPVRVALKPAPSVLQESSVHDALLRMVENGVINLVVVDEGRHLKGLLTFGDLNDLIENQRRGEGCPSKPE